jgi:hypothetical protein
MLSGYRVLSRRYVKSFPAISRGFEAETEMTVHALELCLPFAEVPAGYVSRPHGSVSKLRTIPDGLRILRFIAMLFRDYRPLPFFWCLALLSALLAAVAAAVVTDDLHAWTPAAAAISALAAMGIVFPVVGVVVDAINRGRREVKRLLYLAVVATPPVEDRVTMHARRRGRLAERDLAL